MSVSPIGDVTTTSALQQPAATQATVPGAATATASSVSPSVDAAQAWEDAMRAAMGDESSAPASSDPLSALNGQAAATSPSAGQTPATGPSSALTGLAGQSAATTAATPALTPQALAALVSGSSTAPADPLITSLSAPTDATTPTSDAAAGSFV